jgi:hypothetical protein
MNGIGKLLLNRMKNDPSIEIKAKGTEAGLHLQVSRGDSNYTRLFGWELLSSDSVELADMVVTLYRVVVETQEVDIKHEVEVAAELTELLGGLG